VSVLLLVVIAWGALAVGCVYPSAYWPLLCNVCSGRAGGASAPPANNRSVVPSPVVVGLAGIVVAVLLKLVPLPRTTLEFVSPAADALVTKVEMREAAVAAYVNSGAVEPWTLEAGASIGFR